MSREQSWAGYATAVAVVTACWLLWCLAPATSASERSVVGRSVQGRPIVAVRSGSGTGVRILVIGCIHGDETAGMRIAHRLIDATPPSEASLWVVPTLNPDGLAAEARGNAHGVDLNRNFPFDWQPLGGGEYSGTHALSEPESRAAQHLIMRTKPDVTIWFHQPFGLVDRSGGNPAIERRFSQLIGLPLVRLGHYPGSATSWQNHTLRGSTAFVTELPPTVSGDLVRRGAAAVRTLASEYASPALGGAEARGD